MPASVRQGYVSCPFADAVLPTKYSIKYLLSASFELLTSTCVLPTTLASSNYVIHQ